MEMDVEVDYSPVEEAVSDKRLSLDLETAKEAGLLSLVEHLERTAREAVRHNRQRWRRAESDPGGAFPRTQVQFEGESRGARAAFEGWGDRVERLNGAKRILRASLHGADGTNLEYVDEDYQGE
ncbi:MAG: hypothetical protein C5B48_09555 [Candidatus Rokuibacteriota bacterium]|nr:MAG: hypothetical protein C5B48_09555 [Candidatus Rokubacteria bacterium]